MIRRQPCSTRTDTLYPSPTLFRSVLDSSEGTNDFPVVVDAILDHAVKLGADSDVSGDEAVGEQTFDLGLDSSIVTPFTGSNDGGLDDDGSGSTTVTLSLKAALPDGATLSSDRKSTRLNACHYCASHMPSSAGTKQSRIQLTLTTLI